MSLLGNLYSFFFVFFCFFLDLDCDGDKQTFRDPKKYTQNNVSNLTQLRL